MKNITCPFCNFPLLHVEKTDDGGKLYVAEELDYSTEYYDSAEKYECQNNHYIFLGQDSSCGN